MGAGAVIVALIAAGALALYPEGPAGTSAGHAERHVPSAGQGTRASETAPMSPDRPQRRSAPGRVLVAVQPAADVRWLSRSTRDLGGVVERRLPGTRVRQVRLPRGVTVAQAIRHYERNPAVEYAEPDFVVVPSADRLSPDDPEFPKLYGLDNTGQTGGTVDADIDAPEAWSVTVGSPRTVIAIIDTGVDIGHPDLRDNVWTNPGEKPGNGIDDDGNGYVDDVHGWDFYHDDNTVFDGPGDDHGTHVAGTVAASGDNGVGVTGVSWRAQLMPLKFLDSRSGYVSDAVAALDYAVRHGARISNNSWTGTDRSQVLEDAIERAGARGHLFVTAAGNSGIDIDIDPVYPAAFADASIVTVAATDHNDRLASFSNHGDDAVDLAAPGADILSTLPYESYGRYSGTSMAAPHVAGAAALLLSGDPGMSAATMKAHLLDSVDRVLSSELVGSGGRLNLRTALQLAAVPEVSLLARPRALTYGDATRLAGTVTSLGKPMPGHNVRLERRPVGATGWFSVAGSHVSTSLDGSFGYDGVVPGKNTDYRVRTTTLQGDPVFSATRRVGVRPRVTLRVDTRRLSLGGSRAVKGRVTPAHAGTVRVTVIRNSAVVVRRKLPLEDSRYQWRYRPARRGYYTVVVRWPRDSDHIASASPKRSFRVR